MSKKKKKDNDIYVDLLGGQSSGVTGSATTVSYVNQQGERRLILLECGAIQGANTPLGEYKDNYYMLKKLPIELIDYVFVLHNHADHTSMIPYVIANGGNPEIITTSENRNLMYPMLLDSAKIHYKNVQYLKSKGEKIEGKSIKPLYEEKHVHDTMELVIDYEVDKIYELNKNISFRFRNNSHTPEALQLELFVKKNNNQVKKILYTSDLGSRVGRKFHYFTKDTYKVTNADLMLIESTYGDREGFTKKQCEEERKDLINTIKKVVLGDKKSLFIPCFAQFRLQDFMCFLYDNFKDYWKSDIKIVIDTNLGCEINKQYTNNLKDEDLKYWKEVKSWKVFEFCDNWEKSIAFQTSKKPALILSSSGMISAGRSECHAYNLQQYSGNMICFCGYCSPNTIGGKILNGEKIIDFQDHKGVKIISDIKRYYTFSSHAQQEDLIDYIKQMPTSCKIVLHHGDENAKQELLIKAKEELSKINKTTKIEKSYEDMQIVL